MSSFKTHNRKLYPGTLLLGENGQVVDTIAELAATYIFNQDDINALSYDNMLGLVDTPVGTDLTNLLNAKPRYTGQYVLKTADDTVYYLDRNSIDVLNGTFKISTNPTNPNQYPASIDLSAGWLLAEAEIVNRLATTSSAKIDQVEFRDLQFQFDLDGDKVTIQGTNGNTVEPNPDGSVPVEGTFTIEDGSIASVPVIANVSIPNPNTEMSITFPVDTVRYSFKIRDDAAKAKLSYTVGQSGTQYWTVDRGFTYEEKDIDTSGGITLYFQTTHGGVVAEIFYWRS